MNPRRRRHNRHARKKRRPVRFWVFANGSKFTFAGTSEKYKATGHPVYVVEFDELEPYLLRKP